MGLGPIMDAVAGFFSSMLQDAVSGMIQGLSVALGAVATWFFYVPAPVFETASGGSPAERVQEATAWIAGAIFVVSACFAAVRLVRDRSMLSVASVGQGLILMVLISGAGGAVVFAALEGGNAAAPWMFERIAGGTFEDGMGALDMSSAAATSGMQTGTLVLLFIIMLISVLSGLAAFAWVAFHYGMIMILVGLLPVLAASMLTVSGQESMKKVWGWLGAALLYKPVAAVIYGAGIAMVRGITGADAADADAGVVVLQALYGCAVLVMAAIAMPSMVGILVPLGARSGGGGTVASAVGAAAVVGAGAVFGGVGAAARLGTSAVARLGSAGGRTAARAFSGASSGGTRGGARGAQSAARAQAARSGSKGSGGAGGVKPQTGKAQSQGGQGSKATPQRGASSQRLRSEVKNVIRDAPREAARSVERSDER